MAQALPIMHQAQDLDQAILCHPIDQQMAGLADTMPSRDQPPG
jgi:hypothetical protein